MVNPIRNLINDFGIKLDAFGRFTEKKNLDIPKKDVQVVGGQVQTPSMDENEVDALYNILKDFQGFSQKKIKGINYGRIGSLFDGQDGLDVNDPKSYERMLTNLRMQNDELFEHLRRRKTMTISDMVKLTEKKDIGTLMKKVLMLMPGEQLPAEDVVGGIIVMKRLMQEIKYGSEQMAKIPDTGNTPALAEKRRQQAMKVQVLAGQLKHFSARLSGSVTESARSLSVLANANKIFEENLDKITQQADLLFREADPRLIDVHVVALNNMNIDQKGTYLFNMASNVGTVSQRVISELYINALLTSGVTHAVNIAGNAVFQIMRLAERGIAGGIGEARTQLAKLVGSEKARGQDYMDRAYMGEMAIGAFGDLMGLKDAFTLAIRAGVRGEASDLATKLDLRGPAIGNTDNVAELLQSISKARSGGDFYNSFINIMGILGRLPGRALLVEDEFFKGVIRNKTLYQEAYRSSMALYKTLTATKNTAGKAKFTRGEKAEMVQEHFVKFLQNPPEEAKKLATNMAQKETFQGQVRPPFNYASGMFNNFFGRMVLNPFYKTPSNVFSEIGDRFYFGPGSELVKAVKKGQGREFDEAMAKLVTGWGVILFGANLVAGHYGDDVIITGAGPTSQRVQNIVGRGASVPKNAVGVLNKKTGDYEFKTFSRMDPISMLMTMSADMHNYQQFENPASLGVDQGFIPYVMDEFDRKKEELVHALWLAMSQHATDLPFLQGISEFNNLIIRGDRETGEEYSDKVFKFFGMKAGGIASNVQGQVETFSTGSLGTIGRSWLEKNYPEYAEKYPIYPTNALLRNIERVVSPESTSSMINQGQLDDAELMRIEDIPPFSKGFYVEMNRAKGGHFLYSDEVVQQLNFWGEPAFTIQPEMIEKYGKWRFMYNPFQVMNGAYSRLDQEFIRISEVTEEPFPGRYHRKRLQKNLKLFPKAKDNMMTYELTAEEFNRNVYVTNNIDINGKVKPNPALGIMGDDDYNPDLTMLNVIEDLVFESDIYAEADDQERLKLLKTHLSEFQSLAKKWTFNNEDRLIELMDMDMLDE